MVIEIKKAEQEGWNSNLRVSGLTKGDYIIFAVDGFKTNADGTDWTYLNTKYKSTSYLGFVDVFSYSFFDADKRKVVDCDLENPVRCSWFMSEAIRNRILQSKIPEGQLMKLSMVSIEDSDRTTYKVEKLEDLIKQEINSDDIEVTEIELKDTLEELRLQVKKLKGVVSDEQIVGFLKDKFPKEDIEKVLKE